MQMKSMMGDEATRETRHLVVPKPKATAAPTDAGVKQLPTSEIVGIKLDVGNTGPSDGIDLDHVQPLEPDSFPNAPEKEGSPSRRPSRTFSTCFGVPDQC